MTLTNDFEAANTRAKLAELEERYKARSAEQPENEHVHVLTLQSLKRLINQLKEELALYEAHQPARG